MLHVVEGRDELPPSQCGIVSYYLLTLRRGDKKVPSYETLMRKAEVRTTVTLLKRRGGSGLLNVSADRMGHLRVCIEIPLTVGKHLCNH